MQAEYRHEMFRSDTGDFYENLGEFLTLKGRDNWSVKNCTFFDQEESKNMWAWCLFEKKSELSS